MGRADGKPDQYSGRNPDWTVSFPKITDDDCMDYAVALLEMPLLKCVIGDCSDKVEWFLNDRFFYCSFHRGFLINLMGGVEWSLVWRQV